MVKLKQQPHNNNNDVKSYLAIETCNIYQNSHLSCIHHKHHHHHSHNKFSIQSPFIDWYLILRVAEDASISTIKKQYHNLALLLHPDKNKHPKAEFAFKLISQAYKCLSDDTTRVSFNLKRWRNQCSVCNTHPTNNAKNNTTKLPNSTKNSTSYKIQQRFRVIREKLLKEAKVIEACIRVNQGPKTEYPVFNPSSYTHLSYPQKRTQLFYKKGASFWNVQKTGTVPSFNQRGRCESPVFELRTNYSNLNINSACFGS